MFSLSFKALGQLWATHADEETPPKCTNTENRCPRDAETANASPDGMHQPTVCNSDISHKDSSYEKDNPAIRAKTGRDAQEPPPVVLAMIQ
ncbi:expressed unknown protein [Seminavis robusta]|uniref:Uncharacterized protein n=1 Tax=Seminavis robusta TaxID=568900 RepID=A0A9N8E0X6_9STRA|nr:expressed unknown protein [Seminavis robusta]|eukprot:Sro538_g162490.1 n/a (91) ;mRNA; f:7738-8010